MSIVDAMSELDEDPLWKTKFNNSTIRKADVGSLGQGTEQLRQNISNKYRELGMVLLRVEVGANPSEILADVARFLGFDSAFIPDYYSDDEGLHTDFGLNRVGQSNDKDGSEHRGFLSSKAQPIHVDGTLESIGSIPTTMMYCHSQGSSGGESRLYNSVGAFHELMGEYPELAEALASKRAQTRISVDRGGVSETGPAFAIRNGDLVTRFSLDNTTRWNINEVENLDDALHWMKGKLSSESKYYTEFRLEPGQVLILATDKISHGRNEYVDRLDDRRLLIRGLFEDRI